jgi:hypothetical protein
MRDVRERLQNPHQRARFTHWIADAWHDAGHGLRLLRRSPIFTATAVLSLAIGIGANTAIFTVANLFPPALVSTSSRFAAFVGMRISGGGFCNSDTEDAPAAL